MPNPRNAQRSRDLHILLPPDLAARMELHLYSEAEQRIPYAEKQRFISQLMREFFGRASLDLGTYFHELPPGSTVHGIPPVVEALKEALEAK